MAIVKKNILSILCGIVALLSVAALFWPIGGMYDELRKMLDSSIAIGSGLERLSSKTRTMPQLSPDTTDPEPLKVFPTQPVIDAGAQATKEVSAQSEAMMKSAVDANQHLPLLVGSLPRPDENTKYKFAQVYVDQVAGDARYRPKLDPELNAGMVPTADEITAAQADLHSKIIASRAIQGDDESMKEAEAEYNDKAGMVRPQMQIDRAKTFSVYLQPGVFIYDGTIGTGAGHQLPDGDRIWDAQLSLWVFDDITAAIARCNKQYSDPPQPGEAPDCILRSAVKQIEHVDNPTPIAPSAADLAAGANNTAVPKEQGVSVTGHVSNGLYDVVRFGVILEVDASKVAIVLRELQVNQFITVLNVNLTNVDVATSAQSGFIFGDKPVVRLEIQCEELFLHDWTDNLIPDSRNFSKGGKGAPAGGPGNPGFPGQPGNPGFPGQS